MIPSFSVDDTIVAIATPRGGALRGIVRISGVDSLQIVTACFREPGGTELLIANRRPHWRECEITFADRCILKGRLLIWPTRRSYTRQPLVEFHTLGSPPLLQLVLRKLCEAGARMARPGEFTLRAFLAGRLDLTQAEAVLGLIDAENASQFQTALEQTAGGLAGPLQSLRSMLLDVLAELEAGLDFGDEDISFIPREQLISQLQTASETARSLAQKVSIRGHLNDAIRVVLIGLPNAGKSSLFNAMSNNEGAIVSPLPGTTRDYLIARVLYQDRAIDLCDTAGIDVQKILDAMTGQTAFTQSQAQASEVSGRSEEFALRQVERADVVVHCVEITALRSATSTGSRPLPRHWIPLATKSDLGRVEQLGPGWIATSARNATGIESLLDRILTVVNTNRQAELDVVASTAIRCGETAAEITLAVDRALDAAAQSLGDELIASEIRNALDHLGQILGTVYNDDVLDRVFSKFCIGK